MIVLLDTNVVLRWINEADPQHGETLSALDTIRAAGHQPGVVPQILYELWVVLTRPVEANGFGWPPDQVVAEIARLQPPLFVLLPDRAELFEIWLDLVTRHEVCGKPAHDARLVAAMIAHRVTHLVTFNDGDFERYEEIVTLTPEVLLANGLPG